MAGGKALPASLMLSWRDGVEAEPVDGAAFRVVDVRGRLALEGLEPATAAAIGRLSGQGEDEDQLADAVLASGGPRALASWYYWLDRLSRRGLLARHVDVDGGRLATLEPTAGPLPPIATVSPRSSWRLSRFAYLRRVGDRLVLESPRVPVRLVLRDARTASVIAALAAPVKAAEIGVFSPGLPEGAAPALLTLLAGAGMALPVGRGGEDPEEASLDLAAWEFHDRLFHAWTRKGHFMAPYGATYRLEDRFPPPPALGSLPAGPARPLHRPDLEALRRTDPPLSAVMETRRSIREYGDPPIDVRQLGEFLFRVARLKDQREVEIQTPRGSARLELATRPYPSGGGLYELDFSAAVLRCEGLDPGLYRYDPKAHALIGPLGSPADVEKIGGDAAASAGIAPGSVQVVIVLSARWPRIAWKYASIAYALVLKHVGVIYQSMYLAATAMGLAPCALGGGDSDAFARAAGLDGDGEVSVGEFLLGRPAPRP